MAAQGALQVRGKGRGMEEAALWNMAALETVPGGKSSTAYMEESAKRRAGIQQGYHETDTLNFEIPMDNLAARRSIHSVLPYQPGYGMAMALEGMAMRAPQLALMSARFKSDMEHGDLSEDQERSARKAILDMKVAQAQDLGALAQGGDNRITALFAGMNTRRGRFDSLSMARTALFRSGHPRQDYGFAGGEHLAQSNAFFSKYGFNIDPISKTGELNAGARAMGKFGPGGSGGAGHPGDRTEPATADRAAGTFLHDLPSSGPGSVSIKPGAAEALLAAILNELKRGNGTGINNPGGGIKISEAETKRNQTAARSARSNFANIG